MNIEQFLPILIPTGVFAALGLLFGVLLTVASHLFAVRTDPRVPAITECLPGANCGGCGYSGCAALAEAIARGDAPPTACTVGGDNTARAIGQILGVTVGETRRMRAQVMCSGTAEFSKKKYAYDGAPDCIAAAKMGGGDRLCPNGCIGLGTCAAHCPFEAITVVEGVAVVDYRLCAGCGVCVAHCPKHLIELIPYDSRHWVGCRSVDKGATVKQYCDVGCIGCRLCEKNCDAGAIRVDGFVAKIDYQRCTACDACVDKCPRDIIWSATKQGRGLIITK